MAKEEPHDGRLTVKGRQLHFQPHTHPTATARDFGFRWNKDLGVWTAPLTFSRVSQISRKFECLWSAELQDWHRSQLDNSIGDLDICTTDLYDFQTEAAQFLCSRYLRKSGAFLLLDPGLGKTVVAIRAAEALGLSKICYLGLLSFLHNIRALIREWSSKPNPSVSICHGSFHPARWMLTNYATLTRHTPDCDFDLIITDESVLLKNRRAKRMKAVAALARVRHCPIWLLTGGPTTKFYDDLWAQLNILDRRRFSSYWRFARNYCELQTTYWGTSVVANQPDAATRLREDLADIWFARNQSQAGLNLPEWLEETFVVEMGKEQDRIYSEMAAKFEVWLWNANGALRLLAPNVLSQMTRLLQIASDPRLVGSSTGSAKIAALTDLLPILKFPVVIWTAFIDSATRVQQVLQKDGYRVGLLTGAIPYGERQNVVDQIQGGDLDILVAHPAVGKYSFSMTAVRTAIYLERTFSGDDYFQSMYRIRRIGTMIRPHVVYLLSQQQNGKGTIDHIVHRVLSSKREITKSLTIGWLQKEWERNV